MGSIVMEPENVALYSNVIYPGHNLTTICLPVNKFTSKGLFYHTSPFDYSVPLLLAQLSVGCMTSLIVSRLLRPLGQPSMVTQILAGILIGPSLLGRIPGFLNLVYPLESIVMIDTLSLFTFIFYYFLVGVQLDPWIFKKIDKSDLQVGITTVAFAILLSMFGVAILQNGDFSLDLDTFNALPAVAVQSSVITFPIIAQYLTEVNMVNSDVGRTALASSMVSTICGMCIVVCLTIVNMQSSEVSGALTKTFLVLCFCIFIFVVVRPFIMWALRKSQQGEQVNEGFIVLVLVGVLISAFLSKAIDVRIYTGPLIIGMAIPAGPPLGSALVDKLDLIISWIFMPIYYMKNGLVINVSSIKFESYMYMQYITLLSSLGKFVGAFLSSLYIRMPFMEAVQMGLVMNVQGVLELSLLKTLKQAQIIHNGAFIVVCVSMILVTGVSSALLKYIYDPTKRRIARKRRLVELPLESGLRMVACLHDQADVSGINSIIENLNPSLSVPISICLIHFIELVGRAHPVLIPHKLARVSSSKAPGSRNIINAFKLLQQSYDDDAILMHSYTAISSYSLMHDEVYEMAATRRASLIIVPFHKRYTNAGTIESSKLGIKIMNNNILETSPCTTAILVNRAPTSDSKVKLGASSPLHQVAVFFIGGRDDREALALGTKMASQLNINLTIIRVIENTGDVKDTSINTLWDNKAINLVKKQMKGNQRVVFTERIIKDATGTVDIIRAMENHFELIIVGRNHDEQSPLILGLSEWVEGSELGTVGDMFALPDHKSSSRILVVQHPKDSQGQGSQRSSHHTVDHSNHNSFSTG